MDQELAQYFFQQGTTILNFLMVEHRFAPPALTIDDRIGFATVTFMGSNLAIELILDERDEDVACKIARVSNGKKTAFYAVDDEGVRVREGLLSHLLRKGVRATLFTKVTGLSLYDSIPITLSDFAAALKNYGTDILNDSPLALADR